MNSYRAELILDLHSRKTPHQRIKGRKIIYTELYKEGGVFGTPIPVYEELILYERDMTIKPQGKPKDYFIVLDSILRNSHRIILEAVVEHENVHIREVGDSAFLPDKNNKYNAIAVNTIAFIKSGNPFCLTISEIRKELEKFYHQKTLSR